MFSCATRPTQTVRSSWRHSSRLPLGVVLLVVALGLLFASAPPAVASPAVEMHASINGRPVSTIDDNSPLRLQTDTVATVDVTVVNHTRSPIVVHSVRLEGKVMGLTFFSYETVIDLAVPAGRSASQTLSLDLIDLAHQASGLLPARLELLSSGRTVMASDSFAVHVVGSGWSVYSLFSLAVALLMAVGLARTLWLLATHRLDDNRWKRAVRFCGVGVGVGLTLTFSLSAIGALVPSSHDWLTFVVSCAALFFVLGELTPRRAAAGGDTSAAEREHLTRPSASTVPFNDTNDGGLFTIESTGALPTLPDRTGRPHP